MAPMWVVSIPALVVWLVLLAILERARRRTRYARQPGTPMSEASFEEFTAFFYGAKRVELDQRASHSLMRQEQYNGAPPHNVDLDKGVALVKPRHIEK